MDGHLAGLGAEYLTLDTNDIAHIIFLEISIGLFTNAVSCHIRLNIAGEILHVAERRLTHNTFRHHTSCNTNNFTLQLLKVLLDIGAVVCYIVFGDLEGIFAGLL